MRNYRWGAWVVVVLAVLMAGWSVPAQAADASTKDSQLTMVQGVVLGIVEGLTEYLPVSSTGHLLVAKAVMGLGGSEAADTAINAYIVAIQFGAILPAVYPVLQLMH